MVAQGTSSAAGVRALLRRTLGTVRAPLAIALIAGLLWQGAAVAVPYVAGRAIDDGVIGEDRAALVTWCAVILALGVLRWVGDWYRHWWVDRAGIRAAVGLRRQLLARTADLDEDTANRLGPGQLIARATADVDTVDGWVRGLATLVTAAFTLVAVGVALVGLGPDPALVAAATVPLTVALTARHASQQHRAAGDLAQATGLVTSRVEEIVTGIATVHGLGAHEAMYRRADLSSRELRSAAMRLERVEASWLATAALVPGLGLAAGTWVIGDAVLAGRLSPGDLLAFVGWMALLVTAVQILTERLIDRGQARAAAARLLAVLTVDAAVRDAAGTGRAVPLPAGNALRLDAVAVARAGREVLREVSLDIPPGQWVGVLGASGAGKTSLLRLLPRLADPIAGTITLGGAPLDQVPLADLRVRVGYLDQDAALPSGTVADLLRLGAPDAGDEQVAAALRAAGATEVVASLPGGLASRLGTGGATLSGGQRARIALARVLLGDPAVFVLDDLSSSLDPDTEAAVLAGIRTHLPSATVICATHRLAAARAMDRLVVLAAGRVVADGPAERVLAAGAAGAAVLDVAGTS